MQKYDYLFHDIERYSDSVRVTLTVHKNCFAVKETKLFQSSAIFYRIFRL